MKNLVIILLLLCPVLSFSEGLKPYAWEKDRARYKLTDKEKENAEYIIKQHVQYDYVLEEKQFVMYSTIHRIILVNSNEAIQNHNQIVISMNRTIDLTDLKARAINKDGKVVNFDINNLKEMKNEDGDKSYRIFAIEGVELGSEVEYYFTRKMYASLFDRAFVQGSVPIKNSSFLLTCPPHLKFDFKSYLGFPEIKKNETEELNSYEVSMNEVSAIREEPFAYVDPNRKRIEFKLAYNTARSVARLYTWDEAAKNFFNRLTTLTKDEEKALDKFYSSLGDKPSDEMAMRIKKIEEKIKGTIQIDKDGNNESADEIQAITKRKIASREGIARLLLGVFDRAKIPAHIVLTCSREDVKFDGDFDSWGFLDDYILYFPGTKGFLAPYDFESRYPLVPYKYTAQQGLFIEPFVMGSVRSGLASVQEIPASDYAINFDNLNIDVKFSEDLSSNEVHQKREFGGYNASYFTPYYPLMGKENIQNLVEELTKQGAPDAKISNFKAEPLKKGLFDTFLFDVTFSSNHFLEKAGPRLLFKVGELIGQQTEMYRDDKRLLEVENDFNRLYDRKIVIQIPAGYSLKNPEVLKFDVVYKDGERTPFIFKSSYSVQGQALEILINEYYQDIKVPLARYEDFRKVVNAAADFNKVTLVLEKKK